MKTNHLLLGLSLSISGTGFSQLTLEPPWGSESFASVADRRFTATSTNFNFAPSDGGAGSLSSSTALSEIRGASSGLSVLDSSNGISVPLVRTFATTGPSNSAARGSSVVVEGYTYNGAAAATFSLDATLTGTYSNLDNDFAGNFARLSVWTPDSIFGPPILQAFDPNTPPPDPGNPIDDGFFFSTDEGSYLEFGFTRLDSLRLEQNGIGDDDLLSGTLQWSMEPGDTVYLWTSASSQVYGPDSTADARNTLMTSFQNSAGLTSLSGGVIPEPSTLSLGILGLFALARRKR